MRVNPRLKAAAIAVHNTIVIHEANTFEWNTDAIAANLGKIDHIDLKIVIAVMKEMK